MKVDWGVVSESVIKKVLGGVLALGVLIGGGFLLLGRSQSGFPIIPPGAYVGIVHGLIDSESEVTMYVERFRDTDTLLLLLFADGFVPQVIRAERALDPGGDASAAATYSPLAFRYKDDSFTLAGFSDERGLHGTLQKGDASAGGWDARRLGADELSATGDTGQREELEKIVELRGKLWESEAILKEKEREQEELKEKKKRLEESLGDKGLLAQRAKHEKEELTQTLQQSIQEHKATAQAVGSLVDELELLGRITLRGKAISLARRVAHRENKWYAANWGPDDGTGMSPLMASSAYDAQKVSEALRRAQEVSTLLQEMEHERRLMETLEARIRDHDSVYREDRDTIEIQRPATQSREERKPEQESSSLWNDLF